MKAILQFDLPEEHAEFMLATQAGLAWAALSDIAQAIRQRLKW